MGVDVRDWRPFESLRPWRVVWFHMSPTGRVLSGAYIAPGDDGVHPRLVNADYPRPGHDGVRLQTEADYVDWHHAHKPPQDAAAVVLSALLRYLAEPTPPAARMVR